MSIANFLVERMRNGCLLFLDGRNEHGTHVLACFPTYIDHTALEETLEVQGEEITQAAEKIGYQVGDCVWGKFSWVNPEYHEDRVAFPGYWDFMGIDHRLSQLFKPRANA